METPGFNDTRNSSPRLSSFRCLGGDPNRLTIKLHNAFTPIHFDPDEANRIEELTLDCSTITFETFNGLALHPENVGNDPGGKITTTDIQQYITELMKRVENNVREIVRPAIGLRQLTNLKKLTFEHCDIFDDGCLGQLIGIDPPDGWPNGLVPSREKNLNAFCWITAPGRWPEGLIQVSFNRCKILNASGLKAGKWFDGFNNGQPAEHQRKVGFRECEFFDDDLGVYYGFRMASVLYVLGEPLKPVPGGISELITILKK